MATWGALNNATHEGSDVSAHVFSGGVFATPGGTITELFCYLKGWAGAESSRFGIYVGGAAGNPTGATLIWDTGQITTNIGTSFAWYGAVANFGKTAAGHINAGQRVWIRAMLNDAYIGGTNTDKGDLASGCELSSAANLTSNAFEATWSTDPGTGGSEAIKAYLVYTPDSTTAVPIFTTNYFQR